MSKRKISHQQRFRIKALQEQRLKRAHKKLQDEGDDTNDLGTEQHGLLVAHYGRYVDVESEKGKVFRCNLRQNLEPLVAGDNVIWRQGKAANGVVVALEPRTTLLARPDAKQQFKPIAANIDQVIIVFAPEPKPTELLIDSYIVAVEFAGIKPVLLVNKTDLLDDDHKQSIQAMLNLYGNIGYQVLLASTLKRQGLRHVKDALTHKRSIFVGQSGVGKSSLINQILPNWQAVVGELSERTKLGTHTTTTSRLYHLPGGGDIIDSPGIREFGLWHMEAADIAQGFVDFRPYLGQCKFRDCQHDHEPECAILQAVADGKIAQARLDSFHALLNKHAQG